MSEVSGAETPERRRLGQFGWVLYQLASSPYFVIINIFVFSAYFQKQVVGDSVEGQVVWGYTQAAAGAIIALLSPLLGALADAYGPKKPGIFFFSLIGLVAMTALWWVTPGAVAFGVAAILLAATAMEFAAFYHNAMLRDVTERRVGFMSGLPTASSTRAASCSSDMAALPALGVVALR
jgi:UMF1 family MFS transporter